MIPATTPSPMRTHPTIHVCGLLLLLATSSPVSHTDRRVALLAYPFTDRAKEPTKSEMTPRTFGASDAR
jgi:hypothetical protein